MRELNNNGTTSKPEGTKPLFGTTPENAGFKTPNNYFTELENIITNKISEKFILDGDLKNNPFSVPADYFHGLSSSIQEKIIHAKRGLLHPLFLRPAFALSMAVLFLFILFISTPDSKKTSDNILSQEITFDELRNSDYLYEIEDQFIVEQIDLENISYSKQDDWHLEIKDYLLENHLDINQLTSQLQ